MQSAALGWTLHRGKNSNNGRERWEHRLGRIVASVVFTFPDFRNCTAAVEENTVACGR